jgi:hypothetical protein
LAVKFHPHALERMIERGATEDEIRTAVREGEKYPAKFGRIGFRKDIAFGGIWNQRFFRAKRLEVYAVQEGKDIIVITVVVKYF